MNASKRARGERGFAALFSVIVISLMLLFAVVALGQSGIAGRFMLIDLERKAQSEGYARACIEAARISIENDPAYAVADLTIPVGAGTCTLASVTPDQPAPGLTRIRATSTVSRVLTRMEAVVQSGNADVVSWREISAF